MHISFFDSGKGAYYIAEYFQKQFPEYSIRVHTDTINVPYGNKDTFQLQYILENKVQHMLEHDAQLVIVACNTLSTTHLKHIQDTLIKDSYPERRVLGVAIPTIEKIIESPYDSFLILGTENTIQSKYFENKMRELRSEKKIISRALPTLATIIEQGDYQESEKVIMQAIDTIENSYDVIVLACTHYTILKDFLRKQYPEKQIFSQDEIIAQSLKRYLEKHPEIEHNVRIT